MKPRELVKSSNKLADLTGEGLEYYIRDDGYCIAFMNGKFYTPIKVMPLPGNTEDTVIL